MTKILLATLSILSLTSQAQSFQFETPGGTAFNSNFTTNLLEGNDGAIHCLTRGDSVIMSHKNNIWSYTGRVTNGFAPPSSNPNDFEILPNGDFWVVHFNSIDEWDGSSVTNLTTANSNLVNNYVVNTAVKTNGDVWLSYSNGFGLSRVSGGTWTNKGNFSGSFSDLNNIFSPPLLDVNRLNDDIWTVYGSKFYRISNSGVVTYDFSSIAVNNLYASSITDMTVTDDGIVWFSFNSNSNDPDEGGLLSFDGTNWTHYNTNNSSISSNSIDAISEYGNRVVFTSSLTDGVSVLDNGTFTVYDSGNSNYPAFAPYSYTYDLLKTGNKMYIATNAGILIMEFPYVSSISEMVTNKINISPNPSSDVIQFNPINNIQIIDLLGNIVHTSDQATQINISSFAKGFYTIRGLDAQNKYIIDTFIKE